MFPFQCSQNLYKVRRVEGASLFAVFLKGDVHFGLRDAIIAVSLCQERPHLGRLFSETAGEDESSSVLFSFLFAWFSFLSFHHEPACGRLSEQGVGDEKVDFCFSKRKLLDLRAPGVAAVIFPGCWELQEGGKQVGMGHFASRLIN